jgi:RNA polymerase sigma-70 factor (ECF subfamily)
MAESESRKLIERASRGDELAVEALLVRHLPALRAYVRLRCGPQLRAVESASDIVQSACRDVLENLDRFRYGGEAGFRSWLYATALRKVADRAEYWAAARRDPARLVPVSGGSEASEAPLREVYARVCTPSEAAIGREAAARLERACDALVEADREVIVLSRIVGLSHAEVAAELGITEVAARKRLFRALARLADALAGGPGKS